MDGAARLTTKPLYRILARFHRANVQNESNCFAKCCLNHQTSVLQIFIVVHCFYYQLDYIQLQIVNISRSGLQVQIAIHIQRHIECNSQQFLLNLLNYSNLRRNLLKQIILKHFKRASETFR